MSDGKSSSKNGILRKSEFASHSVVDILSDRELDVFRRIGQGVKTAERATRLHRSVQAVETDRDRIRAKLDLSDGTELSRHPVQWMLEVTQSRATFNLTFLALKLSRYVNGVAKRHGEVSRLLLAGYAIDAITNGVHAATGTCPAFQDLLDRHIPGWRQDNFSLRSALSIPRDEVWQAHVQAKRPRPVPSSSSTPARRTHRTTRARS